MPQIQTGDDELGFKRENLNLDQEGTSLMTYPNQFATNFMSADQARANEQLMDGELHAQTQYEGIYYDQNPPMQQHPIYH